MQYSKEAEAGAKMGEVCRKHGISDATFYKWKAKYSGLEVSDLRKMKTLEAENSKLKKDSGRLVLGQSGLRVG